MIEQAYISGKIGRAIYLEDERYFSFGVATIDQARECRSGDLSFLIDSSGEYKVMSGHKISIDSIKDALLIDTTNQRALSLCISGMDPVLSDRTRLLSIEAAEELIQEEPVYKFVKNRFLARILPESAEVESAISLADSASTSLISDLYKSIIASQESIRALQNVWQKFAPQYFDELDEKSAAESAFIENGLFADMVDAAVKENKSEMKSLVFIYGSNKNLSKSLPGSRQSTTIINNLVNKFLDKLNLAAEKELEKESVKIPDKQVDVDPIKQLIQDFGEESREKVRKSKRMRAEVAKDRVDPQISAIERLIRQQNIQLIDSYLLDLVKFQLKNDKKYLAMTFCNLAKTAMDLNDLATAERLITYAGLLGIEDPVIPNSKAELLRRKGFAKEALAVYEETINQFPNEVIPKNGRAEVLKEMNKLDEALAAYDETIDRFPKAVNAKTGRAEILKEMNKLDEALAAYEETINQFPNEVIPKNGRAEVLKEMNKLSEARVAYDEAISLFPNNIVAKTGRAEVLKEMNRLDEALAAYNETVNQFPNDVVAKSGRAEVLIEMNELDEALAAYDDIINQFPNNIVAKAGRAELLKEMNKLDEALAAYNETISQFPNNIVAKNGRAEVLKEKNRLDEALAAYDETINRFPNNVVAKTGRAEVLKEKNRLDEALVAFDEIINQFPNNVVAKNGRAEVLREMNRLDEAFAAFDETISRFPNNVVVKSGRAEVLKEMNNLDEALAAYVEIISQFPYDVVAKTGHAEVLKEMNKHDEALATYEEIINQFPNEVVAKNGRAEVLKEMNKLDEALAGFDETISQFPNDVVAKCGRAEVLKEMNKLDEALAFYQSLVKLYPNNLVTRNGFANILVLKGKFEDVQSFLQIENPKSKQDWIGYHILAMSYLKAGDPDEAINRFTFGLSKNSPNKDYFVNALAIAKIKKREFTNVVEMFKEDIENINTKQQRTRLLLLGHSYAELHRNDEAVNSLNASILANAPNPLVHTLKNDLLLRYELGEAGPLPPAQIPILDQKIENEEFRLALAA